MKYDPLPLQEQNHENIPPHLRKNKIISLLKERFDFQSAHLRTTKTKGEGILSKCFNYDAPDQAKDLGIYPFFRVIEAMHGAQVTIDGRELITVSTNNYLGLAHEPRVMEAAKKALEKFGTGCTGSRFLNGTLSLHKKLEKELASFVNKEDSIVMSTGYQANQGAIGCLLGRKEIAFSDRENHASIYEGCAVAQGKTVRYHHNDMDHLEHLLKKYSAVDGKLIITDSVFSMSGDICNLPGIVKLAKDYKATLLIDEAHGLGVLGDLGRGVANYYNLEKEVDIYVGTFSKSLGSIGGFVAAHPRITEYIRHKASAFIFTAALPPASVAGVMAALDILITEPERLQRLQENTTFIKKGFFNMGFQIRNNPVPIVPIEIGEEALTLYFNQLLFDQGIFAGVAVSPVVPPFHAMVRTSFTSSHTRQDLENVLATFKELGTSLGIIPQ
ncbi:MAG: aminotransferase class I/II-fold pyridoxal phosphate-dependent enzyme [Nitrospinaceae bacterium]